MKTIRNVISYKKIILNILFLLFFASSIININTDFPYFYNGIYRSVTYIIISGVAVFYIHNLIVLPILLEEFNTTKYKKYVFSVSLAYLVFLVLFFILNKENFKDSIFNVNDKTIVAVLKVLTLALVPLLITVFLSLTYSAFFLSKKVVFQFLEFLINTIIVTLLYVIAVNEQDVTLIILLTIVLIVFYCNTFFATPIFVKSRSKKKYWQSLLIISICYFLAMLIVYFNSKNILFIIFNLFLVLFLVYILSFLYGYTRLNLKAQEKLFTLKLGAKNSELQLLKSQVNPHFLFNTLNTLYATALEENAPKTAESTAKLASLIRYMQADINKDFIPLENEIKYLKDYINIQNLRCAVTPKIITEFVNIENKYISPGLFIPFVENAFKYGIDPSKSSTLKLSIICNENTITFNCVNSFHKNFKTYYKEQGFGIGIKNSKNRLELVYPKKHTFEVVQENNMFIINISITTK